MERLLKKRRPAAAARPGPPSGTKRISIFFSLTAGARALFFNEKELLAEAYPLWILWPPPCSLSAAFIFFFVMLLVNKRKAPAVSKEQRKRDHNLDLFLSCSTAFRRSFPFGPPAGRDTNRLSSTSFLSLSKWTREQAVSHQGPRPRRADA